MTGQGLKGKRVVVTGGAGFVGSRLTERLVENGATVTVIDNLCRGSASNLASVKHRIRLLRTDLRRYQQTEAAMHGCDTVYNLAAINTGIDFDAGRTQYMFEENMLLQMIPMKAAAAAGAASFIQVSSASIYSREAMETRVPTKETDDGGRPEPSKEGYALAKRMGERLAVWYTSALPIRTVIARPINIYGPRDHADEYGHFIPSIIRKLYAAADRVTVFGSGRQSRSFMHVDDAVDALMLLDRKGKRGAAYNIDPQDEHSVRDIIRTLIRVMHKQHLTIRYDRTLPEGSYRRMLDNTKILSLGWRPTRNLDDALPAVVDDVISRYGNRKKR